MLRKSKIAIKDLNQHLIELDNVTNILQGNTWKASLKDTINLYLGAQSSISKRLDELYFTKRVPCVTQGATVLSTMNVYDNYMKENFKDLIKKAINHIEINGVYKNESKTNFLSSFNNAQIICAIITAIGIIYGIGNYLGRLEKDREIIESDSKRNETEKKYKDCLYENENLKKQIDKKN
ncbi:hypothetical protein SAMN05444405_1262 [Bacteroides luti]|uniref:Uncharacterized protein n=1 Tax=Bacteroides luti TaxID=1297750 RepID=A0A1M5HBU9_9BACE|nr:hypothetical protein [Bacteroides luti]SHG13459.1 hypothetical protein SAMN05444405_1262 [Bacteroides luti]